LLDEPVTTSVSGLQMGALFDTADVVDAMRSSGGHLVEVTGQEVRDAQARLAHAADTLVEPGRGRRARRRDRRRCRRAFRGQRDGGLLGTGAGLKDSDALARLAGAEPLPEVSLDELEGAFVELE
jgi:threonine synthase